MPDQSKKGKGPEVNPSPYTPTRRPTGPNPNGFGFSAYSQASGASAEPRSSSANAYRLPIRTSSSQDNWRAHASSNSVGAASVHPNATAGPSNRGLPIPTAGFSPFPMATGSFSSFTAMSSAGYPVAGPPAGPSSAGPSSVGYSSEGGYVFGPIPSSGGPSAGPPAGPSSAGPSSGGYSSEGGFVFGSIPSSGGPSAGPSSAGPSSGGPSSAGPSFRGYSSEGGYVFGPIPSSGGPSSGGSPSDGPSVAGLPTIGTSSTSSPPIPGHQHISLDGSTGADAPAVIHRTQAELDFERAQRLVCPWWLTYNRCGKSHCDFSHGKAPGLLEERLICPYWARARGTPVNTDERRGCKKDHVHCQFAHYLCQHGQTAPVPKPKPKQYPRQR